LDEGIEDIGVTGPEGEGIGSAEWQEEIAGVAARDFVEESGGVGDGFGPGFAGGDFGENGLDTGLVFEFGAEAGDFAVEDFGADAKLLGFVKADTVVLCQGQFCQTSEGNVVFVFDQIFDFRFGRLRTSRVRWVYRKTRLTAEARRTQRKTDDHFRFLNFEFRFGEAKCHRCDLKETWFRCGR
jgi:hypothetical protein